MERFAAYFASLRGKRIGVLGLGVSNRPLVRLLLAHGCTVIGCDRTPRDKLDGEQLELEKLGCSLRLGDGYLDGLEVDVVFRTPGMHPDNPAIRALGERGAVITSEMEAFTRLCPCKMIAVTGSDGKTTTTTLIAKILEQAGKKVWLGGNIGTPLLPLCPQMGKEDVAVVELSSFQLMGMEFAPDVAVITNLAPNHLDVHRDMDEYVEAKKNIFLGQKPHQRLVVNADNGITRELVGPGETVQFSRQGKEAACRQEGDRILRNGRAVLSVGDILLPGVHNIENYMAAILAVEGLAPEEAVVHTARTFGGVEHRIELVRVKDGVRYYNDSIASSPSRTIAGLHSFSQKVILIAGGYDKHIPFDVLGPQICEHVKLLVLGGATGPAIRAAVEACPGEKPPILDCGDFASAVRAAVENAREGDVVLMSPACAAFDQFKNFMERGAFFKKMIMEL